jgi:hypothetical protein
VKPKHDDDFKASYYPESITEIYPLDLSEKTILIRAAINIKKSVKPMDALVDNMINDALFCCQRVLGGVDMYSRLKKKLQELTFDTRGTRLVQCILDHQLIGTHVTSEEATFASEALDRLD